MTNTFAAARLTRRTSGARTAPAAQKVVIVNGTSEVLELLDPALAAGHYDVVVVESSTHAYSQIKRVQPDLVVLCMCIDDPAGFQVLTMLKLDERTRNIPVLTYTTEYDGRDGDEGEAEPSEPEFLAARPGTQMN